MLISKILLLIGIICCFHLLARCSSDSDATGQILFNRLHSPKIPYHTTLSTTSNLPISTGVLKIRATNSTLGLSSPKLGQFHCSLHFQDESLYPVLPLLVIPEFKQGNPSTAFAAQLSRSVGQYDPAFIASSALLYDYLTPEEIFDLSQEIQSDDWNSLSQEPFLTAAGLQRTSSTAREILLRFHLVERVRLDNAKTSHIQCHDIMIFTSAPSISPHIHVSFGGIDYSPRAVLYDNQIHITHVKQTFDRSQKLVHTSFDVSVDMNDNPQSQYARDHDHYSEIDSDTEYPASIPHQHQNNPDNNHSSTSSHVSTQRRARSHNDDVVSSPDDIYYQYLHECNSIQLELALPGLRNIVNASSVTSDVRILHQFTQYKDRPDHENNAILDRTRVNVDFLYRSQCTSAFDSSSRPSPLPSSSIPTSNTQSSSKPPSDSSRSSNDSVLGPSSLSSTHPSYYDDDLVDDDDDDVNLDDDTSQSDNAANSRRQSQRAHHHSTDSANAHRARPSSLLAEKSCSDSFQVGLLSVRTYILSITASPSISSLTIRVSYSIPYLEALRFTSWESLANGHISPTTFRDYSLISLNGYPTYAAQVDLFNQALDRYDMAFHFALFSNISQTIPHHASTQLIDVPQFGAEIFNSADVCMYAFTLHVHKHLLVSPLTTSLSMPSSLSTSSSASSVSHATRSASAENSSFLSSNLPPQIPTPLDTIPEYTKSTSSTPFVRSPSTSFTAELPAQPHSHPSPIPNPPDHDLMFSPTSESTSPWHQHNGLCPDLHNSFTHSHISSHASPLSRTYPLPDVLFRSLSPQTQQIVTKYQRAYALTDPQRNLVRGLHLVEWAAMLPQDSLCPQIQTEQFYDLDFPRHHLVLWFECVFSSWQHLASSPRSPSSLFIESDSN